MYKNTIISKAIVHASNIPGWRSKRRIVVIESDDWGSIRTFSKDAYHQMKACNLQVDKGHYNVFDALESNEDLESLYSVLSEFKDSTGRSPVFTPFCLVANPDFEKIEASDFREYFHESLERTLSYYPEHDKVLKLWKIGIDNRLFVPGLHGREHINIRRYIDILRSGDRGMRIAFKNRSLGVSVYRAIEYPNYLGALHPESLEEVKSFYGILEEAGVLFQKYCGYVPKCFIAPNMEEPKELETVLKTIGVKYLTRAKKRRYPIGDGTYKTELNWLGKKNKFGQFCLVRNCFFEPVARSEHVYVKDWVDNCMKEVEIAFKWYKPAIISSHRVNYIGFLDPDNRDKGLCNLRRLLKTMLQKWPEIEFLTSEELGDVISESKR